MPGGVTLDREVVGESEQVDSRDGITPVTMRLARAVASMGAIRVNGLVGGAACGTTSRHGNNPASCTAPTPWGSTVGSERAPGSPEPNKPAPRPLTAAGRWLKQCSE